MSKNFNKLSVKDITRQTPEAVTVTFDVPSDLKGDYQYKQGQYLTLKMEMNGQEVRRAYSMSSSPLEEDISVTVKKVDGGKMSPFINDRLQEGQTLEVMTPEGRFYTNLDAEQKKTYYLFGAGSGITPLMSILKTILEVEPLSSVYLFYGNRNEASIIFKDKLEELEHKYTDQLTVVHTLSQPKKERGKGLGGFFSKKTNWTGKVGRIDRKAVKKFLEEYPDRNGAAEYFICGPGSMIDTVAETLQNLNMPKGNIHIERFTTEADKAKASVKGSEGAKLIAHLEGEKIELDVPEDKTLLDVLLENKYDAPYSCTAGACSSCMAKVLKGSVKMEACYALDNDEIADGYILTCQSHPTSDVVEITYEE